MRLAAISLGLLAVACSPSLEGRWQGDVYCPGASPLDMEVDLTSDKAGAEGRGSISWMSDDYWEIRFFADIEPLERGRERELDVWVDDCTEIDLGAIECGRFEATWYVSEDRIEGEILDLFGVPCDFELE